MFDIIRFTIGAVVFFGICGWAAWRGGWPERVVSLALVADILGGTPISQTYPLSREPEMVMFAIDFIYMLVVVFVALRSDRWWPLFCGAFAFLGAITHLAQFLNIDIDQFAYITAVILWSYCGVFSIAGGMFELRHRKRRLAVANSGASGNQSLYA